LTVQQLIRNTAGWPGRGSKWRGRGGKGHISPDGLMLNVNQGEGREAGKRKGGESNLPPYVAKKSALVIMVDICGAQ
jgi:hypothetical protein